MWHLTHRPARRPLSLLLILVAILALVAACSSGAAVAPGPPESRGDALGGVPVADKVPSGQPDEGTGDKARDDALIVRTGSLDLEVTDFDASLAKARTAITGLGGYVSGSQMALDGDRPYASITYRIPSARWDDALIALKGLAVKALGEQTQAIEVTTAVVDLEARLDNLRATERSLQAIMVQATKIPDILEVQGQLTNVRGQIEQLVGERDHLKDQAAYGTLTVGWTVPLAAVTQAQQDWDPAKTVDEAIAQLVQLGQGVFSIAIWFAIVGLPLLLVGLLVVVVALAATRRTGLGRRPSVPTPPSGSAEG